MGFRKKIEEALRRSIQDAGPPGEQTNTGFGQLAYAWTGPSGPFTTAMLLAVCE
jgi:hypothetical protein